MSRIRSKGTKPELEVRRLVHRLGYRYRLHVKTLPGKPDLVFRSRQKVILVHGCFWHKHDDDNCKIVRAPKSNTGYWTKKLDTNAARDSRHLQSLRQEGWDVLTLWECQLADTAALTRRIMQFLRAVGRKKSI